jgi:alpha-1,2-mannosyltransferase
MRSSRLGSVTRLRSRSRLYAAVLGQVLCPALVVAYLLHLGPRLVPPEGTAPMDFQCFWAASKVALTDRPTAVYDLDVFSAAQVALHGRTDVPTNCKFIYIPVSLLLFLPLALLPYTMSALAWLAATATAYALALRALLPGWAAVMPFFAFPAAFLTAWYVQNGFLSAALIGTAAVQMARRPVLAGVCLGCLVYKPQLGLVLPVALAAAGRWRAFAAASVTVLGSAGAATAAFGVEIWPAFLTSVEHAAAWIEDTPERVASDMASVFSAAKMLTGGHLAWAYAAQAAAAAAACALMVPVLRRGLGGRAEVAVMGAAIPLATPYLLHYDQVVLAVPLAWVLAEARRSGFLPWERAAFVALMVSPAVAYAAALAWKVPLAPLVSAGVFALVLRRARHLAAGGAADPPARSREPLAWARGRCPRSLCGFRQAWPSSPRRAERSSPRRARPGRPSARSR